ncbi:MAG: arylsulfatase, partial [Fuerstiella sp.]
WPLIAGVDGATSPQEAYFFYWGNELHAIRSGKWKLHFPHNYRTMAGKPGGTDGNPTNYSQGEIGLALFDLESDVGETTDVAAQNPEVVSRLSALADEMRNDLGDKKQQGSGRRPIGKL